MLAVALSPSTGEAQRRGGRRHPTRETPTEQATTTTTPAEESGRTLSEADRAQARALFQAGSAAVDAGRWADAVSSFRAAYELTGAPSALFNTGFALRALGRYREAREAFVELLGLSNVTDTMQAQTRELLAEVRDRIARVRLTGLDPTTRYGVRLDGTGVEDDGSRPFVLEADPGSHAVDVSLTGHELFTWTGALGDGATVEVPVVLVPLSAVGGASGGSTIFEEAWFWLLVGGVVVVGAGLATYFVLDDQAQLRAESPMVLRI